MKSRKLEEEKHRLYKASLHALTDELPRDKRDNEYYL